jgi:hypothetical protein
MLVLGPYIRFIVTLAPWPPSSSMALLVARLYLRWMSFLHPGEFRFHLGDFRSHPRSCFLLGGIRSHFRFGDVGDDHFHHFRSHFHFEDFHFRRFHSRIHSRSRSQSFRSSNFCRRLHFLRYRSRVRHRCFHFHYRRRSLLRCRRQSGGRHRPRRSCYRRYRCSYVLMIKYLI